MIFFFLTTCQNSYLYFQDYTKGYIHFLISSVINLLKLSIRKLHYFIIIYILPSLCSLFPLSVILCQFGDTLNCGLHLWSSDITHILELQNSSWKYLLVTFSGREKAEYTYSIWPKSETSFVTDTQEKTKKKLNRLHTYKE